MITQAARLLRRQDTPWRALHEAADTFQRQFRHVGMLVEWLRAEWQEGEFSDDAATTTETVWELAGELFRVKRQLILVFARVSNRSPREILETLQDMEASEHHLTPPPAPPELDDEE